jgi:hypothetical protein
VSNPQQVQPYPAAWRAPVQGVRCLRCHIVQPPIPPGHFTCVACGAVLPLQRWVAHPPPGAPGPARKKRPSTASPGGPPSYRFGHPRWGFPAVVWRPAPTGPEPAGPPPSPLLRRAAWLAWLTAAAALVAAGAELWRFLLMIDGRTRVLSATEVATSDALVAAVSVAVLAFAILTAAIAVTALIRTHRWAAVASGRAPSRSAGAVAARLLVPGWNAYGAGQILVEIDTLLGPRDENRPRAAASRLVLLWWFSWIVNAVLVVVALGRGLGGSLQAVADTVELHIAVDLSALLVAGLGALVLRGFARLMDGPRLRPNKWVVQPPAPTRPLRPTPVLAPASSPAVPSPPASSPSGDGPTPD